MKPLLQLSLLILALVLPLAPGARAQKLDNKYRQFPAIGVEFKPLKDFSDVPVNEGMASMSIVGQMDAVRGPYVKGEGGAGGEYPPSLKVFHIEPEGPSTGAADDAKRPRERRTEAKDFVEQLFGGQLRTSKLEPEIEEFRAGKDVVCERAIFDVQRGTRIGDIPILIDVYTFLHGQGKVIFVWDYPTEGKLRKKWEDTVVKSMRSFREMKKGAADTDIEGVTSDSSYEELLEYHENDVAQTPGWRLVETRSKQYLIKTNSDDKKDIDLVIARLEASRELYEKDFPPPAPITQVSVVRICKTRDEFNTYGQTGGGVAGYFNPRSEELVLFFGESGKDLTLSVMAHEAFHQYCHFLFGRAEAHRWFDEGHGDYYGAWKQKGRKLIQEEDMKGGLARMPELKEMRRAGTIKPLSQHIRYDHGQWQSQGPSNVSCYAQSFGLVYFLRRGAEGDVSRKYWKDEYADILPNYIAALSQGFSELYEAVRQEGREELAAFDALPPDEVDQRRREEAEGKVARPWDFARAGKEDIWERAMKASWGQIDEDEFEQRWLEWIDDTL